MSRGRWPVSPALVALGELTDEQRRQADGLLADDERFRAEVERLRRTTAVLAAAPDASWQPPAVPPLDIDRAVAARPAPAARRAVPRPRWRVQPLLVGAAAAVLVAVGIAGGLALAPGDDTPSSTRVASMTVPLTPLPGTATPGERASVRMPVHAGGEARLTAKGLRPSPDGHYYELWLMTDDKKLASIGTFRVGADGRADVRFAVGVDPSAYRYVDISVEPDDGRPGHSATSVLRSAQLS